MTAGSGSIAEQAAQLGITPDELRERLRQENIRERGGKPAGWTPIGAIAQRERESTQPAPAPLVQSARRGHAFIDVDPFLARRNGHTLTLVLRTAPRTAKNHTHGVSKAPSIAFRRYETWIHDTLRPHLAGLELPLPDGSYNVCALFYYDGTEPDLHGLMQGLADALEADAKKDFAGVFANDRCIGGWDFSRKIHDPIRPRVEITIAPLGGAE
jgi:hypothetical protein